MTGQTGDVLTCQQLVELVTAYLDGALDPDARARFDMHLMDCDGCESYLQQFRRTVHTLGRICDEEFDPAFRERLLIAFRHFH
jgi:anti-sigma factor RsiW